MRSVSSAGRPARLVMQTVCPLSARSASSFHEQRTSSEGFVSGLRFGTRRRAKVKRVTERRTYSYLGPAGTFTEAALDQVPEARGQQWRAVHNVGEALDDVLSGRSHAAMIAIENSVEGGVSTTHDALATLPGLRVIGEYLVQVNFVLVAPRGTALSDVTVIAAHPVAYAQCHGWLGENLPQHAHVPAASNVASAIGVLEGTLPAQAAIAPPGIVKHYDVDVLAEDIGD